MNEKDEIESLNDVTLDAENLSIEELEQVSGGVMAGCADYGGNCTDYGSCGTYTGDCTRYGTAQLE